MTAISAHELMRTRTCAHFSCPNDAAHESGLCDEHEREEAAGFGETAPEPEPVKEAPVNVRTCKRDGCDKPWAGKKMGVFAGLCADHIEEARAASSARFKGKPRGGKQPNPTKARPPDPPPPAKTTRKSLVELAQAVEDAEAALQGARIVSDRAVTALRDALAEVPSA